jgi:DNA-nicking Smr family endonuclease
MTLDFLLRAFRKALAKPAGRNHPQPEAEAQKAGAAKKAAGDEAANHRLPTAAEASADPASDPFNPFPDPVVIEFTDVLDLHSIPPKQVRAVVEDYLEEARRRGFAYLRIIHGKGIGVQREMIRSILSQTAFVSDFRDAPPEAGGWGATIVTLQSQSET